MSRIAHKEILEEVRAFEQALSLKYNCSVRVTVSLNKKSLKEVADAVNTVFQEVRPVYFETQTDSMGIRKKGRHAYLILFRAIYYALARECGFPLETIGVEVGVDHATVLHGTRSLEKLLGMDVRRILYMERARELLGLPKTGE